MRLIRLFCIFIFSLAAFHGTALAQATAPDEVPDDIEREAREIGRSLRCVVCQNQSIEDSDAELAADMRAVVRQQLIAGDSAAEIRAFMQERYGDYVLFNPPLQANTILLWFAPPILLVLMFVWFFVRRQQPGGAAESRLTDAELEKLKAIKSRLDRLS